MHPWTAAGGRLAGLVALWLVCVARCRAVAAAPSGAVAERLAIGGLNIEAKDLPDWWLPIYSPTPASPVDGYLCGIGVRFGRGFLLAHKASINRTRHLVDHHEWLLFPERIANIFRFKPETVVNAIEPYWHWRKYYPFITDTFEPEIGLYFLDYRSGWDFRPPHMGPTTRPPFLHQVYPLETSVCLETNKSSVADDCRLVMYGPDLVNGNIPGPHHRLKMIGVRDLGCNRRICSMATLREGKGAGQLCGYYANFGSPIICGKGNLEKITYLVWSLHEDPEGVSKGFVRENCTRRFSAFKIATIADELWNAHSEFVLKQQVEQIPPRPEYLFLTTSRRPL